MEDVFEWAHVQAAPVKELFPGIRLRPLWAVQGGASAQVLEMDADTSWEGLDVHQPGPEEVFVVSGTFNDGIRDYPAGSTTLRGHSPYRRPFRLLPPGTAGRHSIRELCPPGTKDHPTRANGPNGEIQPGPQPG